MVGCQLWCCVCMWCCVGVCLWGVSSLVLSSLLFSSLLSSLLLLFSSLVLSLFLHVSFSFFLLCFLFSFLLLSFLSSSLSLRTQRRHQTDRQVTLPTENGHAPRDPLNQERAINLSILSMSQPGKFSRVESN